MKPQYLVEVDRARPWLNAMRFRLLCERLFWEDMQRLRTPEQAQMWKALFYGNNHGGEA